MTRTAIRQEEQVQPSEAYTDNVAPSLANFETNTSHLEDDLNNVRSQLHNLMKVQTGNWYDDLATPATFTGEGEAQRGVDDLNSDLHELERKRILRRRQVVGADIAVPSGVAATGSIDCDNSGSAVIPADTETFVLNDGVNAAVTFEFDTDSSVVETATLRQVDISSATTDDDVRDAIISAVTGAPALDITATSGGSGIVTLTHDRVGTVGNQTITETVTNAQFAVSGMSGGAGDVAILGAGELPGNTTAAIGAVTTRGTVCAYNSTFGTATLAEVVGGDALVPKNMAKVADAATGEPIVDGSGNEIHALLQSESNTDGSTITATTPNRVQLSFVVHNATNDDLELVDGQYIAGQSVDYSPVERYAFDDIPEHAWLGDDFVDAGAAAVTRQSAYDNQGTVPVDLTTNATLDLEGAGLTWVIRDDLEAILFRVIEGSAGGTSEVEFGADVDSFDNDAGTNDFANELKVDTGTTPIHIGVTAGHVETTGSDDLHLQAANEMYLDDGNQIGSTWAQTDGIKLSETTAEWDAFETEFGEVSLLNAIVQAAGTGTTRCKAVAQVSSADISANTLIEGPSGPGTQNISGDLCDYRALTFVDDVDIYINGLLQRNGADAAANHDVYPSAVTAERQYGCFYCEYDLKYRAGLRPDVITMIAWGDPVP